VGQIAEYAIHRVDTINETEQLTDKKLPCKI